MMFQVGDGVIHPHRGAGTVIEIEKLQCLGSDKLYYAIRLADGSRTQVWVAVQSAVEEGVRHPVSKSQSERVWGILSGDPETLPADHKERYELLRERIGGNVFRVVAEVVRDMFWKSQRVRHLTIIGKRLYDKGIVLLASEIAIVQGCEFADAETRIRNALLSSLASRPVAG
jgi:RNA polymerase-interacting CarD/CdnL/TRCF family regulator